MNIRMTTSISEVDMFFKIELERAHQLTIRALMFLGEKCVIEARDRSPEASWNDQSGNLRSSIGYVVVYNGKIVDVSGFSPVGGGSDGSIQGEALAKRLAQNYQRGYALIVVAGMNYAAYVEAMKNKVVLASAELMAKQALPSIIKQLKNQIAQ